MQTVYRALRETETETETDRFSIHRKNRSVFGFPDSRRGVFCSVFFWFFFMLVYNETILIDAHFKAVHDRIKDKKCPVFLFIKLLSRYVNTLSVCCVVCQ
jgi:hypothetical protein